MDTSDSIDEVPGFSWSIQGFVFACELIFFISFLRRLKREHTFFLKPYGFFYSSLKGFPSLKKEREPVPLWLS